MNSVKGAGVLRQHAHLLNCDCDAFASRNDYALKIDFVERPPYFEVSPTHKARTWLLDPRAPKVEPPENIRNLRSVQEGNV